MSIRNPIKKLRKDLGAISPLVATLLLIAIAVAASVITYSWVMSMIGSQSQQAQTQVRIDQVEWHVDNNKVTITVRNLGSVAATVESISVRRNLGGLPFFTNTTDVTIQVATTMPIVWNMTTTSLDLEPTTSYVIRVTCTTGFYYEIVASTPA